MMRLSRRKVALSVAGATGLLAVGIAVPTLAYAQDPSPSPSASAPATSAKPDAGQRQDELAAALADKLGIDKEKVATALAEIRAEREATRTKPDGTARPDRTAELKTRLDAAVKAGTITQAEADAIVKAAEAGVLGGGGHRGPR
jgi:uncharacterized protein (DUF1501 family)